MVELVLLVHILTILIPINGLILLALIKERKKNARILLVLWRWKMKGRIK